MPYTNEEILRDKNNNPIPQIWDSTINKFVPYEGKVQLTGQTMSEGESIPVSINDSLVEDLNGGKVIRTKQEILGYRSLPMRDGEQTITVTAGSYVDSDPIGVNGFSTLAWVLRDTAGTGHPWMIQAYWSGRIEDLNVSSRRAGVVLHEAEGSGMENASHAGETRTYAPFVMLRLSNRGDTDRTWYMNILLRAG